MKLQTKRILCLLLTLVLALSAVPAPAFASEADETLSNFEYTVDSDTQTITLTKYIGTDAAVVVADSYTVDGVTYATVLDSNSVFRYNSAITSVTIGSGVAFKDNSMAYLFSECKKLVSVDMTGVDTSEITSMAYLFDWCNKLTTLTGYENWDTGKVENIYKAFNRNNSISTVDLSGWDLSSVVNSGWCFQQCYATEIKLPDNLKTISAGFLNHASKVTGTTFTIPAGVEKIGYAHTIYDFATDDFVEFIVAEGNEHYVAIDGILYSTDGTEMLAVPRNKTFENNTYEIPEGVTFLGELSFSRNYNIHTLVLPDSYIIEYVPLYDDAYIVFEDIGNLNAGTNLSIAIYCYTGITEYAVKDSNPNYTSQNGIIYSKDMTEVVAIPARYAQEMIIPEGVTTWNMEAMWADTDNNSSSTLIKLMANCPGVTIPASLKTISEDQLSMLNLLYTSRKGTSNPFTITIAEGNASFELDENEGLVVKAHEHTYENGVCVGCGVAEWDTDGDGVLEILAIGNSFSVDALQYVWQIANDLGVEEIVIGNLYIGGCTLETHATNAAGNLAKYTYYYNDSGTWTSTSSYKISTALESRSWDYVSLQQGSPVSGVESSYNEDLTDLIAYVQARSNAKLVWHMTWAYQQDSTHSAFPTYNSDQTTMYNAIVSAMQNKIVTNDAFDLIVPNGTAVQNSRTSLLGDTTTRDGYHMTKDYGRYLTGLLFIKTVTGLNVDGITYRPSGVDAEEQKIAIESVNNAAANPFAVTQSLYIGEVPEEGYILLETELYQGAYWYPMKDGQYNELITSASNSKKFFATIRFTRETLPVGSILVLADGYQYRPDGWVTDELQTGTREDVTTQSYVVVTEEWWGDFTIRSFNISLVSGGSVMSLTEEEMRAAFRIYVPEELHKHDFEGSICILCGKTNGPVITKQPESIQVALGEKFSVKVEAEGEDLTYQWYYKHKNSESFSKSSFKSSAYSMTMATYCHNREIYCVITDANGNSVQTETVLITAPLTITKQPTDVQAEIGQSFSVSVSALGDGLTYQWYYKNRSADEFMISSFKGKTYSMTMREYCHNREIYCVITDAYGNSVTTDTVTITRPPVELVILSQPADVQVEIGQLAEITMQVQGEGLTYQWYYKNASGKSFTESSFNGDTYAISMQEYCHNRQVYCVITDKYGNSVTTEIATMSRPPVELEILEQPADVYAAKGEKFVVSFAVQGEGLTYQWYYKDTGMKEFKISSNTGSAYSYTTSSYHNGRQVYCVITDQYGNQVTTDTATIYVTE